MTKSIIHPGKNRPINKATMDQPQEEFVDDQRPPSRKPEPSEPAATLKKAPPQNPLPSRTRE